MVAQQELARRFAAGHDVTGIGSASNLSVESTAREGYDAVLLGYGHAVYAARRTDGSVVRFDGWRGYSQSTTCQLTELRKGFKCLPESKQTVDTANRPKLRDFHTADPEPLAAV